MSFGDDVVKLALRRRRGYQSFCAVVDLLGVRAMLKKRPSEAGSRLNDLQKGFGEATFFFPGGSDYRACFVGDSWFVVKEVTPDEQAEELWPAFCGHIYALTSFIYELEKGLGNPGLRVVVAAGPVSQVEEPDEWRYSHIAEETKHWFVLTGADQALVKSERAQRLGKRAGFFGNFFWFEVAGRENLFWGAPFRPFPAEEYQDPTLYPEFFDRLLKNHSAEAALPVKGEAAD